MLHGPGYDFLNTTTYKLYVPTLILYLSTIIDGLTPVRNINFRYAFKSINIMQLISTYENTRHS